MRMLLKSLLILVMAATLFSACTTGNITQEDDPISEVASTDIAQPTATPSNLTSTDIYQSSSTPPYIAPTDITQPTGVPPDVVHLGVPWADFSLRYDPLQWEVDAFDDDWPALQSLTHRTLSGYRIIPNIPVGLGADWTIEKRPMMFGQLELEVRSFYQNGELKFVDYSNFVNPYGDGAVEVHFVDNSTACIQAAEALLAATEVILP